MIRIVVVLPAPFEPRKPKTSPGLTVKLTPSSAWTGPKRLRRPLISSVICFSSRADAFAGRSGHAAARIVERSRSAAGGRMSAWAASRAEARLSTPTTATTGSATCPSETRDQEEGAEDAGPHQRDPDQHREGDGPGGRPTQDADARDDAEGQEEGKVERIHRGSWIDRPSRGRAAGRLSRWPW